MFPSSPGPTAKDMNYTVVVGGGWILLCVIYYWIPVYGGACWFRGPIGNLGHSAGDNGRDSIRMEAEEELQKLGGMEKVDSLAASGE